MAQKVKFLADVPIERPEDDALKHSFFVSELQDILENCPTPWNIGIFGKWGTGKTGVVKLLENKLETDPDLKRNFLFFYVDAWKLTKETLRQQILIGLNRELKEYDEEKIDDLLHHTTEFGKEQTIKISLLPLVAFAAVIIVAIALKLSVGLDVLMPASILALILVAIQTMQKLGEASVAVTHTSKRIIPRVESPIKFEEMFNKIIARGGNRTVVICVDNLDRCDSDVVVDMLGTIKTFMDVRGCIYLLPCDNEALEAHLAAVKGEQFKERNAKEFLRKFFHTYISIPPIIDEDFEKYAELMFQQISISFDATVKQVLVAATTKNPRRVKQFINSLVPLYDLAAEREKQGVITKGLVLGNAGFLAKVAVIREEWPPFFDMIARDPENLEIADNFLAGADLPETSPVRTLLENSLDLRYFLNATRPVRAENIGPFIRLTQESWESAIPDLARFMNWVKLNDLGPVQAAFSRLDDGGKTRHANEIIKIIDESSRLQKRVHLFNSLNTLIAVYDSLPVGVRPLAVRRLETNLTTREIVGEIQNFNSAKIFQILRDINEQSRDKILVTYSGLALKEKQIDVGVLDMILQNSDLLGPQSATVLNDSLKSFLGSNEQAALPIIDGKFLPEPSKAKILQPSLLNAILDKFDLTLAEINRQRNKIILATRKQLRSDQRITYVGKVLALLRQSAAPNIDEVQRFAVDILTILDIEDVETGLQENFYDTLVQTGDRMSAVSDKLVYYGIILKHFKGLSSTQRANFETDHLGPYVSKFGEGDIVNLIETAGKFQVDVLSSEVVLRGCLDRLKTNLPSKTLAGIVLSRSPTIHASIVAETFSSMVESNDAGLVKVALDSASEAKEIIASELVEAISKSCVNVAKQKQSPESEIFLQFATEMFDRVSEALRLSIAHICIEYARSEEVKVRSLGISHYRKIRDKLDNDTRVSSMRQIVFRLQAIADKIEPKSLELVELILEEQDFLDEDSRTRFIDVMTSLLSTAKGDEVQEMGIRSLASLKELGKGYSSALKAMLELAKAGNVPIRRSSIGVLDSARKNYRMNSKFWKEFEKERTRLESDLKKQVIDKESADRASQA